MLPDGRMNGLDFGGQAGLVPGGEVDQDVRIPAGAPGRELFHQLGIASCAADAVQALQPGQNGLHLGGGEDRPVHPVSLQNRDAPASALGSGNGDPGLAEGFNVPLDGAAGYLKLLRQFRRGDLVPLEQDGQNADETFHFHGLRRLSAFFVLYHRSTTAVCHVSLLFEKEMGSGRSRCTVYLFPKEWSILSHTTTIRERKSSMNRSKERHLFLTSNGLTDSMKRKLFSLIGKTPEGVKVLYIPTAGIETDGTREGFAVCLHELAAMGILPEHILIYNLELIVSRDYPRTYSAYIQELPMVSRLLTLDELQRFDVVFVSGGDCAVLCREMKRTGFD